MVMGGLDPQKMAEVQKTSSQINAELRVVHDEHEIRLKLIPTTPESLQFVKSFVTTFTENIATQLSTFFNIRGKIIDVNKPGEAAKE